MPVSDFARSLRFYDAVMGAHGHQKQYQSASAAGWGVAVGIEFFEIKKRVDKVIPSEGFHLAFHARDKKSVHHFHEVALANGGTDNGSPGARPDYETHFVKRTQ